MDIFTTLSQRSNKYEINFNHGVNIKFSFKNLLFYEPPLTSKSCTLRNV